MNQHLIIRNYLKLNYCVAFVIFIIVYLSLDGTVMSLTYQQQFWSHVLRVYSQCHHVDVIDKRQDVNITVSIKIPSAQTYKRYLLKNCIEKRGSYTCHLSSSLYLYSSETDPE
jgi:hypothetical protein